MRWGRYIASEEGRQSALFGGCCRQKQLLSMQVQCYGRVQTGWEECQYRPDYRPAIGATALHQIHMFIFITAIVHIALGVLLVVASTIRIHLWGKWRDQEDMHARM